MGRQKQVVLPMSDVGLYNWNDDRNKQQKLLRKVLKY